MKMRIFHSEDGQNLVETALSLTVLLMVLFALIEGCFTFYTYSALNAAAREASRYAAIRGANSCVILSTFPDCNMGPTTAGNPLQTYVHGLALPSMNATTVTATWYAVSVNSTTGSAQWGGGTRPPTACTTLKDANNNFCNNPGNMVRVVVTAPVPIELPFVPNLSALTLSSTSAMVIDE